MSARLGVRSSSFRDIGNRFARCHADEPVRKNKRSTIGVAFTWPFVGEVAIVTRNPGGVNLMRAWDLNSDVRRCRRMVLFGK
jgi:hypothetical protein